MSNPAGRLVLACVLSCAPAAVECADKAGEFYRGPGIFSTRPSDTKSLSTIDRFGPVGIGIELLQPAFVMRVKNVEAGSPADGKLLKGQYIESINGQKLRDIDPRIQLGRIVTEAEAADGVLRFEIKDKREGPSRTVDVKVPAFGSYSATWPLDCAKSDRIVRSFANHLATLGWTSARSLGGMRMLFLLSTGEAQDLAVVRRWVHEMVANTAGKKVTNYSWYIGYGGLPLAEYYLRTGDKTVLPLIQRLVDSAEEVYYLGGWAGRGHGNFRYMGGGHLNAAGTPCAAFLLLAKECGVDVEERVLHGTLEHFFRFAGRGNNPYGDHKPENGFVDNGKNGTLAFAMAAAASLSPEGEDSLYARARDVSAISGFYTTSFMLHGHTGGGIGEIWRSAAMGFLYEKSPKKYREFLDERKWHYELSRRWDGSFGILGGAGYDDTNWGVGYALAYTIPRRTLRLSGAPPTTHSVPYELPSRAWGTEADDAFLSLTPASGAGELTPEVSSEVLATDSGRQIIQRLVAKDVSDDVLLAYAHHPYYQYRRLAACKIAGVNLGYLGNVLGRTAPRPNLLERILSSADPRVRRAAVHALFLSNRAPTNETVDRLVAMVRDPKESWWVVDGALEALSLAGADQIVPHVDTILTWLEHRDWWLQNAAVQALAPVAADERVYRKILPALGEAIAANQHNNTFRPLRDIVARLQKAEPAIQQLAVKTLGKTFTAYPDLDEDSTEDVLVEQGLDPNLEIVARTLSEVPGGFDVLYEVAQERFPDEILPYDELYLSISDLSRFGPKVRRVLRPLIVDKLIPQRIGQNRVRLLAEAAAEVQSSFPGGRGNQIDELTALYRRAGVDDHDWRLFGPDLRESEWEYFTFDPVPAEQVEWDRLITRYRDVTLPSGQENWFTPEFDAEKAGWKRGLPAFAQYLGELPKYAGPCSNPACFCRTKARTLWDKEVLLLRKKITLPAVKEGHLYRVRINDGDHVGDGGGYAIYINGRLLIEQKTCVGRGGGAKPKGAFITQEFRDVFDGGEITIAVKTFLRFNSKYKVKPTERIPQGRISVHLEEMLVPPLGPDELRKSATVVPMRTSKWQANQSEENRELRSEDDQFRFDGIFVDDRHLHGTWQVIDRVASIDEFDPLSKRRRPGRPPYRSITFRPNGTTDGLLRMWTGNTLMDLERNEALAISRRTLGDMEFLFIEAGGFSPRHRPDWRTPLYVLQRQEP